MATSKITRKVSRHRVGGGGTWPGKAIGIGHRITFPSQSIILSSIRPSVLLTPSTPGFRKVQKGTKMLRTSITINLDRIVHSTEFEDSAADGTQDEESEGQYSEKEHQMAADLTEHAGRKKVKLEDLKLARTLAAMLRRTF
ncbi:hypothetical protein DL98DRAFT_535583 [Cadophora sp. DSE1049]|nr:hypothetical protein DL98DRAFT_535583 [Cadophora sp. DSE1049]